MRSMKLRTERRFSPSFSSGQSWMRLESRELAVVFTPTGDWQPQARADGFPNPPDIVRQPVHARAENSSAANITDPNGVQIGTHDSFGYVDNIIDTVSGPSGASTIDISVSHYGRATIDTTIPQTWIGGDPASVVTTSSITNTNGDPVAATWAITDPGAGTANLTATFHIDLVYGQDTGTGANSISFFFPTLVFVSNQISVYLETPDPNGGAPGFNYTVYDNTTIATLGVPTLIDAQFFFFGNGPPFAFSQTYQVTDAMPLPGNEVIAYASTWLDANPGATTGASTGSAQTSGFFNWSFSLTA